jgi:hypothetical protein
MPYTGKKNIPLLQLDSLTFDDEPVRHFDYKESKRSIIRNGVKLPWDGRDFIAWDGEGVHVEPHRPLEDQWVRNVWKARKANGEVMESEIRNQDGQIIGWEPLEWAYDLYDEPQPQPYVLLANSLGQDITRSPDQDGLTTLECFEFILETKREHPHDIFVGSE